MPYGLATTGIARSLDDTDFSPRKETKKLRVVSDADAESALDASVIKDLIKDQGHVLASMGPFVEELTDSKVTVKEPREFLKVLLMEGYMDENGLLTNNDNEKLLIWKAVRRFNSSIGKNLVDSLTPELDNVTLEEITGTTVPELIEATNKELKKTATALNQLIVSSSKKNKRLNEAEQKIIRNDLSMEHLRLLAHDLDLKTCHKNNAWEIAAFAKSIMIKNHYQANKEEADKKPSTAKEIADNSYLQAHSLMQRMTVTAMGKTVKKNHNNIETVPLILTFATEGDKEAFRNMGKDCGIVIKPSLPKGYIDQKALINSLYKKIHSRPNNEIWVKVDVRPCRPEDQMSFTVQTKAANGESRWTTAGKVVIISPTMWGRLSIEKREAFIKQSFDQF